MRESSDEYKNGKLVNGFDYDNQVWVRDGKYVPCGHPKSMQCNCYGRLHEGEETTIPRIDFDTGELPELQERFTAVAKRLLDEGKVLSFNEGIESAHYDPVNWNGFEDWK